MFWYMCGARAERDKASYFEHSRSYEYECKDGVALKTGAGDYYMMIDKLLVYYTFPCYCNLIYYQKSACWIHRSRKVGKAIISFVAIGKRRCATLEDDLVNMLITLDAP